MWLRNTFEKSPEAAVGDFVFMVFAFGGRMEFDMNRYQLNYFKNGGFSDGLYR